MLAPRLALRPSAHPRRPPQAGALLRPVPVYPRVLAGDEGRIAHERLRLLLADLDRRLQHPLEVERSAHATTVWVLGEIGYCVDHERRAVYPVERVGAHLQRLKYEVELYRPLRTNWMLEPLMRRLELCLDQPQRSLFSAESEARVLDQWVRARAYARLLRDPRFIELRCSLLPRALGLDPEIAGIAVAARPPHYHGVLHSAIYNAVWGSERSYRRLARENPRLLGLAYLALLQQSIAPCDDLALALHRAFRSGGISAAGWRYFTRHGTRLLAAELAHTQGFHALDNAIRYLRAFDEAGLPPPPPRRVANALLYWRRQRQMKAWQLEDTWCPLPPPMLAMLCQAARARPGCVVTADIPLVAEWADALTLDKLQRRAGWPSLVRRAGALEKRQALLFVGGDSSWDPGLEEQLIGRFRVVPLASAGAMADEALAMHNCLADRIGSAIEGKSLFFSVRDAQSGKRVAVLEMEWNEEMGKWVAGEVKGPANGRVGREVEEVTGELGERCVERFAQE